MIFKINRKLPVTYLLDNTAIDTGKFSNMQNIVQFQLVSL